MSLKKIIALSAIRLGAQLPAGVETIRGLASLRELLSGLDIDCVLDVGANRGQFVESLRLMGYRKSIVSFEPLQSEWNILKKRFSSDRLWYGFNIALGDKNINAPLIVQDSTVYSSFLTPLSSIGTSKKYENVIIRRLDDIFRDIEERTRAKRFFLKMDTQGYDLKCFFGASGIAGKLLGLLSELSVQPLYTGMPHYIDVLHAYERAGFQLVSLTEVSRSEGAIQEMDCLMRISRAPE